MADRRGAGRAGGAGGAETEARGLNAALAIQGRRTALVITHNPAVAARCDRIVRMEAGRVVG